MLIRYDNEVIALAKRIAMSKTASREDVVKLIRLNDHTLRLHNKVIRSSSIPESNYLGKEAIAALLNIAGQLPTRKRH